MNLHTRKDFEDCLKKLVDPLKAYYTPSCARVVCGHNDVTYGDEIAQLEAFARPLWGLAPLWGGGSEDKEFEKLYIEGIIHGTDPNHEDYWGEITDYSQRMVETAALGLALILAPHKIWEPLTDKQKDNLAVWLSKMNELQCGDGNWRFFVVLVNLGLKTVGRPWSREKIAESMEKYEACYRGDGWYTDNVCERADYYIPFAMQFYTLVYAKVMEKEDAENSRKYKERACAFAKDFIYWFAKDGAALCYGRSLTYRFAQCCFFSACVFAGIEPFSLGVMKGIIARHLSWWMEKPIFDNGGILSVGYTYPNLCMSEGYNAYGSPYWALKSFLVLALPESHPFWQVEAEPLPELDALRPLPHANMVIQRTKDDVIALALGQRGSWTPTHGAEKYFKFAYSAHLGFSTPRSYESLERTAPDNMLTFVKDGMCFVRRSFEEGSIGEDGTLTSIWSPYAGVSVKTVITPTKDGHTRCHTVTSSEPCVAYEFGFATKEETNHICGEGEKLVIKPMPNTNLINPKTVLEGIKYEFPAGETTVKTQIVYQGGE